jgi:hypothetical protein
MNYFLRFASHLTNTPTEEIKVINYTIDENGFYNGIIEINGHKEFIHEYTC